MTAGSDRPIRIGVQLQPQHADYAAIRRACARVEELGADVIFKTDAVVRQGKATFDMPRIEDVVRHLFGMGLTYKTRRFAPGSGGTVKAWAKKPSTPGAANGPQQSSPTASVPPAQVATETHNDDLPPPRAL